MPFNTSVMSIKSKLDSNIKVETLSGLLVYSLPDALCVVNPQFFVNSPFDARTALAMVSSPSDVLTNLLRDGKSTVASRLVGAFRNIGRVPIHTGLYPPIETYATQC